LSSFLLAFTDHIVRQLLDDGDLLLQPDATPEAVIQEVADFLAQRGQGHSAISSFSKGLLACDGVDELFADDDAIKQIVDGMPRNVLPR